MYCTMVDDLAIQRKVEKKCEGAHAPKAQTAGAYRCFLSMMHA